MKNFINILVLVIIFTVFLWVLKIAVDKQVKRDCLNAQRHLIEYHVPIPEDLNSLCVELDIYKLKK